MLSSPTKYQIVFLNSFPFDWFVIPLLLLGALMSPCAPFQRVDDEKNWKNWCFFVRLPTIARNTCPVASTSSFCHSPGPPLLGDVCGFIPTHHHGHWNGQQVWCFFRRFFLHATPLSAGMIRSKYLPDGGVQWLLVKPWTPSIGQCTRHCTGTSSQPSKQVATVVYCFALLILTSTITVDNRVVIII